MFKYSYCSNALATLALSLSLLFSLLFFLLKMLPLLLETNYVRQVINFFWFRFSFYKIRS